MNILKRVYKIFPEINWIVLNRTTYPRIRFYFDESNISNEKQIGILNDIFTNIFKSNIYCCLTLFGESKIDKKILKSLELNGLDNIVNIRNEFNVVDMDYIKYFQFFSKIKFSETTKINKLLISQDLQKVEPLDFKCYYFNFETKLVVNLYDDRGMDIICDEINTLKEIKKKFEKVVKIKIESI